MSKFRSKFIPGRAWVCLPLFFACVCFLAFTGCGSGGPSERVTGSVACDGTPLPGGLVVFSSDSNTCSAKIEDGKYEITLQEEEDGPRDYVITVFPPVGEVEYNPETDSEEPVPSTVDLALFPERYQNKVTTDLKYSPEEGSSNFDIVLTSDP